MPALLYINVLSELFSLVYYSLVSNIRYDAELLEEKKLMWMQL